MVLLAPAALLAQPAKADRFGDALPEGAVARLGTARLRHDTPGGDWHLFVAFSGDNTQFNREAARAAGCNEFLAKPLEPEALSAVLRRFLPVRDAQAANS